MNTIAPYIVIWLLIAFLLWRFSGTEHHRMVGEPWWWMPVFCLSWPIWVLELLIVMLFRRNKE